MSKRQQLHVALVESLTELDEEAREALLADESVLPWAISEKGILSEDQLLAELAKLSDLPALEDHQLEESLCEVKGLSHEWLRESYHIPFAREEEGAVLHIALAHPADLALVRRRYRALGWPDCRFSLARRTLIERRITQVYENASMRELSEDASEQELRDLAEDAPVVRLVNDFFARAVETGTSDIHVEPEEDSLRIRFRIDGVLREFYTPPLSQAASIASRLKLIGGLNIAEHRLPQDGRINITIQGKEIDLRMNTLPGLHGESIVMRLLPRQGRSASLDKAGMNPEMRSNFEKLIQQPHGIILVVGPTGSGKTTTLYAALGMLNSGREKIITIEDPVEYRLKGITQVQIKPAIGLTFASGLRSIVRQDPDIILIGEIRDLETARIAVQAALTGHLVLSTLHTNDAAGAITRLQDMGIESFLISSSIIAVLSQRLVRTLCVDCQGDTTAANLNDTNSSCRSCGGSGYKGRCGIFELLPLTDEIRQAVNSQASTAEINKIARAQGMKPIIEDGLAKAKTGITSKEEILRVCRLD